MFQDGLCFSWFCNYNWCCCVFVEISRQIPPLSEPAGMFLVTHVHQLNMNGQSEDWMGMRSQVSSVQTVSSPNIHRFGINSATSIQYFEFHTLYVKWVRNQLRDYKVWPAYCTCTESIAAFVCINTAYILQEISDMNSVLQWLSHVLPLFKNM